MNVCIIGDGLTSLSLAKNLIKKKINVHIYDDRKNDKSLPTRTIGISKDNIEFFKKEICKFPNKDLWKIKQIEIFSEKLKDENVLNFVDNKNNLFYMIKNDKFYSYLNKELLKNKFFKKIKIKKKDFYKKILKKNKYDLIINCEKNNFITKKYFSKVIFKDYKNLAFTTILNHQKLENNTAIQVFTKFGPIAYLPISNTETSVVCSLEIKNREFSHNQVIDLIHLNNPKFKIKKISEVNSFRLMSSSLRNYYYKNILAFGNILHRIHPLAGQGLNMTIRDIKILSAIIQNKIDLGMQLDASIFDEFEKKTKHMNFIFSNGIDFIYEFFNFDRKIKNKSLNKILRLFGKNKSFIKKFIHIADRGLNI